MRDMAQEGGMLLSDEESKAIQEMAKAAGKSVNAAEKLGGFLSRYLGGPIEQMVGLWHDKLKYRRWENQIVLAEKAKSFLKERGLDGPTRTLELSLAIPLLEEASLADSEELQDRWATLLANAADANSSIVRRAYVTILAEITSFDALLLDKIFDEDSTFVPTAERPFAEIWTHYLPEEAILTPVKDIAPRALRSDVSLSLVNLGRLGLIDSAAAFSGMAVMSWVSMTELGRQFVLACKPCA